MGLRVPFQRAADMLRNDQQSAYPELWRGLLFGPFGYHGTLINIELPIDFLDDANGAP